MWRKHGERLPTWSLQLELRDKSVETKTAQTHLWIWL